MQEIFIPRLTSSGCQESGEILLHVAKWLMCECTWLDYRNNATNKGFPRTRVMSGQAGNDGKAKTGPAWR
jgi:hypothetical protein